MDLAALGTWTAGQYLPAFTRVELAQAATFVREPVHVVAEPETGRLGVARGGSPGPSNGAAGYPWLGSLPALWPEWLGDRAFTEVHGLRFPYVAGAMANGIHTAPLTIALARAGMLGYFGAAGLSLRRIEGGLDEIQGALGADGPAYGMNLIHSPNEPQHEMDTVALYLARGVRRVEAAAYLGLNPMIVRFAYTGLRAGPDGRIVRPNHVMAKISRPETARRFLSPAPADLLDQCVAKGWLTADEARLARRVPVADDLTVESDSGGHTDNRPLGALFPTLLALRDELAAAYPDAPPVRVGAAGGIGTPASVASAFGLGAAYVVTGSVNQAAVESGLSPAGKQLLAVADLADVIMAPAADMFEMGVEVQVLRRGTMFGTRAHRLHDLYTSYAAIEAIPADTKQRVERELFQATFEQVWDECARFFAERNPAELERANREPKHKLALVCRWYLGLSSKWAIAGDPQRKLDYQIWCGPAMGAFNAWVKGTFLEPLEARTGVEIALNLLEGAARLTRAQQLRSYGVPVPASAFHYRPEPLTLAFSG